MADGDDDEFSFSINDTPDIRALKTRLADLREEHRALDSAIIAMQEQSGDALQLARLKKRKLVLRDQIQWIEDRLTPDIIA
ncbi:MAG: YdcH family protein [Hyphomonadaceae bacterium]